MIIIKIKQKYLTQRHRKRTMTSLVYVYGSGECEQLGKFSSCYSHFYPLQVLNSTLMTSERSKEPENFLFSTKFRTPLPLKYKSANWLSVGCTVQLSRRLARFIRGDVTMKVLWVVQEKKTSHYLSQLSLEWIMPLVETATPYSSIRSSRGST